MMAISFGGFVEFIRINDKKQKKKNKKKKKHKKSADTCVDKREFKSSSRCLETVEHLLLVSKLLKVAADVLNIVQV